MARVDHMQEEIGVARLIERRAKRRHEVVRQLANEADRIGEQHPAMLAQIDVARERVERREEAILDEHVLGAREIAQNRRLPDVRVADERRSELAATRLTLHDAALLHVAQTL